jgi:hypothetical protein
MQHSVLNMMNALKAHTFGHQGTVHNLCTRLEIALCDFLMADKQLSDSYQANNPASQSEFLRQHHQTRKALKTELKFARQYMASLNRKASKANDKAQHPRLVKPDKSHRLPKVLPRKLYYGTQEWLMRTMAARQQGRQTKPRHPKGGQNDEEAPAGASLLWGRLISAF